MKKKILIVASTSDHLMNFHMPYIKKLKENYVVKTMAKDTNKKFADFNINFEKKVVSFKMFKVVKEIRKILKEEEFDVVFTNTTLASFWVRYAVKSLKKKPKVINVVHGYLFDERTPWLKKLVFLTAEKFVKNVTDDIIVMNNEDEDIATKHKLCKNNVVKIAGMGIDGARFSKEQVSENFNSGNNYEISFIGELSKRKNQKFLIEFVKQIEKYDINIKLTLIGDGNEKKKLQKIVKNKKLSDKVVFHGYDNNIQKHLQNSDYYITGSRIEGLPFNVLEAMHVGCVIFASDIKGNVDLIDDLENGILFRCGDVKNLIEKFRLIKNNKQLQEKIREKALKDSQKYLLENIFEENIQIFTGLIND